MALLIRLRRAAAISSSILKDCSFSSNTSHSFHFPLLNPRCPTASSVGNPSFRFPSQIGLSSFHSSIPCSIRRVDSDQGGKIPEDEILFEGCDYNHWLITMDFPKDPKPSAEEMVETYVQTLAKVVGSVEEAKKRMYACSTTTYNGFQAVMSEEMSEKFRGLPGVVFILPDSYIDPVNKEYGGDKYDNGVITPRPPPIHYGRQGRYGDRNRRYDQPRYERQRSPPQNYQGNPPYDYQGSTQGYGRNYTPQQNYGPPGQDGRSYGPPGQDGRSYGPPGGQDGSSYGPPGQDGRSYGPPGQDGRSYSPPGQDGRSYGPPGDIQPMQQQGYGRNYGPPQNYGPPRHDGRSYGGPGDSQQGYQHTQQYGNPQMQQGNPQYSHNAPQQNYGPHGDKERD